MGGWPEKVATSNVSGYIILFTYRYCHRGNNSIYWRIWYVWRWMFSPVSPVHSAWVLVTSMGAIETAGCSSIAGLWKSCGCTASNVWKVVFNIYMHNNCCCEISSRLTIQERRRRLRDTDELRWDGHGGASFSTECCHDNPNQFAQMLKLYLQPQEVSLTYMVICLTT